MKKILTLNVEQAGVLYKLLSEKRNVSAVDNRKRWKFLSVIEDFAFAIDDLVSTSRKVLVALPPEQQKAAAGKVSEEIKAKKSEVKEFVFADREIFAAGKDMFGKAGDNLVGRESKIYVELENAFMDVKDVDQD